MFAAAAPWYRLLENMICDWFKIILITAIYYIFTHTISCRTVAPREIRVSGNPTFPPSYSSAASTRWKYMNTTCMFTDIINSNIRTCIFTHTLIKQGSHFIQIYNLQIFLSDLIDSINLYRKRCSIERGLAISFFSPFIITKQGQWYLEAWSHFFFNYMTNDSKQIPVHRIITMCNLISYMFIVLKRGIRTCRCLTTARKI